MANQPSRLHSFSPRRSSDITQILRVDTTELHGLMDLLDVFFPLYKTLDWENAWL